MKTVSKTLIKKLYPKRDPWCYKGNFGKLLVIGGSKRYSGSPAFASLAAIKSGADLVTTVSPQRAADIVAGVSPDLITYPVRGDYFNPWHLGEVLKLSEGFDAVVIGGGMERNRHTFNFIIKLLENLEKSVVVDADAIYAVAQKPDVIKKNFVLTPHSYEFFMLTGKKLENTVTKRADLVKTYAKKFGCIILLKGHVDIISDGKTLVVNKTGCPQMTKGGTGDILAGILGALLVRKTDQFTAACGAAYINGKAGELAAREFGESLMAEDVLKKIHKVLK